MTTPPTGSKTGRRKTTLKRRVAIELVVVTVAFNLLVGMVLDRVWVYRQRRLLDDRLEEIALDVSSRWRDGSSIVPQGFLLPEVVGGPVLIVLRGPGGEVIDSQPRLRTPLPLASPLGPDPTFQTIEEAAVGPEVGHGGLRLATVPAPHGGYVQAGTSLSRLLARENLLGLFFFVVIPTLAGLVTLCAWLVAGRRLDRLRQIARLAARIGPGHLHKRLDVRGPRDEFVRLAEEVNRMLERLESGFAAQDRFISEVAHELKTPVSVMLLEAQVLARSDPDMTAHARFVASVEDEMRRLSKLIESFLTLARARHGRAQVRRERVDMNDAALDASEHCYGFARQRDIRMSQTLISPDEPVGEPLVAGDPELLRTMIENLLRNAIAVSPRGAQIGLRVARVDHHVGVHVRDQGPGVPADMADRLFERFVTADHTRAGIKGSGLGLAIARGIAELHGGRIHFSNMPPDRGGGAEFSVEIPLLQESPVAAR